MKRKIFSIMAIAAIAFVSCKKEEEASTELGSATINGNVWADLDQTDSDVEGVTGMQVSVVVNTMDWDQQPVPGYNYDEKVYSTLTDASGNYTLTIPATDEGYNVTIEFEDLYTTRTTLTGTQDVKVTRGNINKFIWNGAVVSTKDEGTVSVVDANSTASGMATFYGTVYMNYDIANWNGAPPSNQKYNTASGQTSNSIVWMYDSGNAPYGATDNTVYTATYDYSTGNYTLTVPTEALGGNSVYIDFGFMDFSGTRIENNQAGTADSTVSGIWSCGGIYAQGDYVVGGDLLTNYDIGFNFSPF